jgi:hypothetical protein
MHFEIVLPIEGLSVAKFALETFPAFIMYTKPGKSKRAKVEVSVDLRLSVSPSPFAGVGKGGEGLHWRP